MYLLINSIDTARDTIASSKAPGQLMLFLCPYQKARLILRDGQTERNEKKKGEGDQKKKT